ncbi:MAG: amidohydrolase [Candidatus Promineifilaceae bacterium]
MDTQLLTNGKIYTMDASQPTATAVAMRDGKLIAVGSDEAIRALGGTEIDLDGRCVIPGLIDSHVHFEGFSLALSEINLLDTESLEVAMARIETRADATSEGEWLLGRGWTQADWASHQFPTSADLDSVSGQHPAYLRHRSGHAGWVNSRAMRMAGIDANTPDPSGGQIQRDADGNPTGILFETAMELVADLVPPYTEEQIVRAMREGQAYCWKVGLVGVHDFDGVSCFQALQTLQRNGELGLRIVKNIPNAHVDHAIGAGLRSGFGDEWIRIGGVKMFADGALGPRTALMIEPYEGDPDNRGMSVLDKEEMMEIAHKAYKNQLAITVHAIGDQAVHDVIDICESIQTAGYGTPPAVPNRIEHVQIVHPMDHHRLAELDVIASMQPIHATSDITIAERNWGSRTKDSYALRTMLESGATVVFGSDSPVEPIEPLIGIHAAVTRQRADSTPAGGWHPEQAFTMQEAIHAFTTAAAITSRQEARAGSITVGKLADLTILEKDIFEAQGADILSVGVAGTVVGGEFKYRAF